MLKRFFYEEDGQGMVEYGLIIALVAIAVITVLGLLGDQLVAVFDSITDKMPTEPTEPTG